MQRERGLSQRLLYTGPGWSVGKGVSFNNLVLVAYQEVMVVHSPWVCGRP
jgi:hypothetical protein